MFTYREMDIHEAERISEIDATNYIKNAWRMNSTKGEYELVEINLGIRALVRNFLPCVQSKQWALAQKKYFCAQGLQKVQLLFIKNADVRKPLKLIRNYMRKIQGIFSWSLC